jgi:hypothetical protein
VFGAYVLAEQLVSVGEVALNAQADSALVVVECHFPLQNRTYSAEPHR